MTDGHLKKLPRQYWLSQPACWQENNYRSCRIYGFNIVCMDNTLLPVMLSGNVLILFSRIWRVWIETEIPHSSIFRSIIFSCLWLIPFSLSLQGCLSIKRKRPKSRWFPRILIQTQWNVMIVANKNLQGERFFSPESFAPITDIRNTNAKFSIYLYHFCVFYKTPSTKNQSN